MPDIRRVGYLLVLMVGTALATAMAWKPTPGARFAGMSSRDVPRLVDGRIAASDDPVPRSIQAALSSASLLSRTYGTGADAVNFVLIGGTDRDALHDPRACLIGSGMQIEDDHQERLTGTHVDAHACRVADADILYFYVINGKVVSEVTEIRAAMLWSALLGRRETPVYFLRFTRGLEADPRRNARGHERLARFAADMWNALSPRLQDAGR